MEKGVFISGSSKGIGKAIAKSLHKEGWSLFLHGRNENDIVSLQKELNIKTPYWICDYNQESQVKKLAASLFDYFNSNAIPLKALINNAGIYSLQNTYDQNYESWKNHLQVNFLSSVIVTEALAPLLKKNAPSHIINISSTLGLRAMKDRGAYGASKAALNHWTQTLALELGKDKIQVNAICPGIIDTPIHDFHNQDPEKKKSALEALSTLQPLGRIGNPEDIAQACAFLLSDKANWITGALFNVDGGIHLT